MYAGKIYLGLSMALVVVASIAEGARIKDIANLKGVRDNQLSGYGIVIGLPGTGDKDLELTSSSLKQVLKGMGISQKLGDMPTKNVASVLVTAKLPAFAKVGHKLDILVSSVGTASSLEGGTLVMTPLKGPDGGIYAMAQGKLLSTKLNSIAAELPGGATLEREIAYQWGDLKELRYQLMTADFTTAARMAYRINEELAGRFAVPMDAGTVNVTIPFGFEGTPVDLVALIETIDVEADQRARVVVNPRTSTVVIGDNVRVLPVAVAHGNLSVEVKEDSKKTKADTTVNLPVPPLDPVARVPSALTAPVSANGADGTATLAAAQTPAVTPAPSGASAPAQAASPPSAASQGTGKDKKRDRVFLLDGSVTVKQLVDGLNAMGASGEDLVQVLRSIQSAGALQGELEIL